MGTRVSQLPTKGANLADNDLLMVSEETTDAYISKSITGAEIIASAQEGLQPTLVSGTNIKTVNDTSLLGSGNVAVQPTLVSGTNIKTVNGNSLLGSGDLVVGGGLTIGTTAITSGTIGRILFEGTGNVLQESANLFWDNTNGRLGIGTSSPSTSLNVIGGAEEIATEQMLAKFSTSTTGKELAIGLVNLSGKYWKIRSLSDGSFDLRNITDSRTTFSSTSTGNISIFGNTFFNNNSNSITNTGGINGLWLQKAGSYTTSNYSICSDSTATFINAVGGGIFFRNSNSTQALLTSTGNLLIGTTTDAGYKLDVNGTTRIQSKLSVGIPSATSAVMEVTSTTQGFLPPRMTTTQRNAIASPASGLIVYDTTDNKHYGYNGTAWTAFY